MPNRLAHETSPYLLQHAHNPVDWYPWGEEAFARARAEDKPIFLSIGYAACHWCHVMERESFEDPAIGELLAREFVAVKVDREERPDVDSIYMQAVQLMTGHGGWPMSVFLTPDGKPFYAGTYFPPIDRHGLPGFQRVLIHTAEAYRSRRSEVEEAAEEVRNAIASSLRVPHPADSVSHEKLDDAAARIAQNYDRVNGGFGGAPKFPPSMTLDFLLQVEWRSSHDPSGPLGKIVTHTLTNMARGGMYDQIGGGFHRYSVDARWLVPHFEKMLYDNALLARLYTRAWQWTRDPFFARIAHEILGWVQREMWAPEGGFYSTLDADSEGEEGKFYVWTRAEVMEILGADEGRVFCALFDITERGNWEGHNILNVPREPESVAADLGLTIDQLAEIAARGKCKLYGVRSQRIWPARDEKILAGWNGWMLAAFAEASIAFGRYEEVVRKNADFLLTRMDANGRLTRHAHIAGLLEDYAGVAWGLLLAFEAVHDRKYLDAARLLIDQVVERFADEAGGFYDTPSDGEELMTRPKDLFDNATPSGNSVAAEVLIRLSILFGNEEYARTAERTILSILPLADRYPSGFGFLLSAAEWRAGKTAEIVLTGDPSSEESKALKRTIGEQYLPHRVLVAGASASDLPLMQDRPADRVMAYLCEGYVCQEPTSDPERLRELLSGGGTKEKKEGED
ncbi:MAG TPA: thioredoxin domain-containing protein [Thermoanaerobaculia bacterium]|nr:thioredoxin domain-containing protein [Thermoanaerobaculia bacterium]